LRKPTILSDRRRLPQPPLNCRASGFVQSPSDSFRSGYALSYGTDTLSLRSRGKPSSLRLRGGPGRTRTSNQIVMSSMLRSSAAGIFASDALRALDGTPQVVPWPPRGARSRPREARNDQVVRRQRTVALGGEEGAQDLALQPAAVLPGLAGPTVPTVNHHIYGPGPCSPL
jgi:hypothetical protein